MQTYEFKDGKLSAETAEFVQLLRKCVPQTWHGSDLSDLICHVNGNPDAFADNYLHKELLSKYNNFRSLIDTKLVALDSFRVQEIVNFKTNRRLRADPLNQFEKLIKMAQTRVAEILKGNVRYHMKAIMASAYFGPGITVGLKKGSIVDKVSPQGLTCTRELLPYAHSIVSGNEVWKRALYRADGPFTLTQTIRDFCVSDSRLTTVPKNAKTDRTITVEPNVNSFVQNGIGRHMRNLLASHGILLDLQERNRNSANISSQDDSWATIDLSNASNSLTVQLVYRLLEKSEGWFQLLDLVRSKRYTIKDHGSSIVRTNSFQLFSGMGNGYTFPLETLIFFCLTEAVMRVKGYDNVEPYIYGDDIIVPSDCVMLLGQLYQYCGLEVNTSKSFVSGPFRESCGGHYYNGFDVTPMYVRKDPASENDWHWYYTMHNQLWRWASRDNETFDTRVIPVLKWLFNRVPRKYRFVVPPCLGDVGFWPMKSKVSKLGHFKALVRIPETIKHRTMRGYWLTLSRALEVDYEPVVLYSGGRLTSFSIYTRSERASEYSVRNTKERVKVKSLCAPDFTFDFIKI